MDHFYLLTEHSLWYLPLCLLGGALYAAALYTKTPPWSKRVNWLLAGLRLVVVSLLLYFLLEPFVRYISNDAQKPVVVVALDNSESVQLFNDSTKLRQLLNGVAGLQTDLSEQEYRVEIRSLDNEPLAEPARVQFTAGSTNLDAALTGIRSDLEGRNLAAVVLVSDGIFNQGRSPLHGTYPFPVYTVGIGDTSLRKDVQLASLLYNKVSYSGNRIPLAAEIRHNGFKGQTATVVLSEGGKTLEEKKVVLPADGSSLTVSFLVNAVKPGKKHFVVTVQELPGEFTAANNFKHAYLEVIEGKVKVLLAAAAPHPDIKAIRTVLEAEENMEVTLFLPGIHSFKPQDYDVAILHQLPSRTNVGPEVLAYVQSRKIPALYVVGMQTSLPEFNRLSPGLTITAQGGGQADEVTAVYNAAFNRFALEQALQARFPKFPPVDVPFGEYRLSPGSEIVLRQQVGSVPTQKPVLAVQTSPAVRSAVLVGDGIWQWRLNEFATTESTTAFDQLLLNVVQLLTVKENKKRLHVYPVKDEYSEAEDVNFEADVYNEVFQKVYGQKISLALTHEDGSRKSFSFVNGANFSRFNLGSLKPGLYRYEATAQLGGKTERDQGELVIQAQQLEALQSEADFNLLYQLAASTNARFYPAAQLNQLTQELRSANFKPLLYTHEKLKELLHQKWLFFVLLSLISLEWFLRKYKGGY